MNLSVEVNKKLIAVILAIGSLTVTLLGFMATEYLSDFKATSSDVLNLKTEVVLLKQKIDDDDSQWQILQRQDSKIQAQEVQIEVLKLMMKKMSNSQCNEVVVRIEREPVRVVNPPVPIEVPPPSFEPPESPPPAPIEEEKIFEDLEKKIDELDRQENYQDYRREQMIQQRSFPNERSTKK